MEYSVGQVVFSKAGRDRGRAFIIRDLEGEYIYVVDGTLRRLEQPKKKKIKHIQGTKYIDFSIKEKLENNSYILNADIAKALKEYSEK